MIEEDLPLLERLSDLKVAMVDEEPTFYEYHVHAYLAEARERRRLSLFPERNPNLVLSLARDGTVLYANPGAATLRQRLSLAPEASRRLLPPDIGERLARALRAGRTRSNGSTRSAAASWTAALTGSPIRRCSTPTWWT